MKKIKLSIFSFVALGMLVNAQQVGIAIEKESIGVSSLLEFPDKKVDGGILLPRVESNDTAGQTPGTLIYNGAEKKAYYYGDGEWIALTDIAVGTNVASNNLYQGRELRAEGMVIEDGTGGEAPVGVLTLESRKRALALPVVDDVTFLPNPIAGTICYDKASSSLAIFNGSDWYFWR